MKRIYALRRIGTAKMRYELADSVIKAEEQAKYKEKKETGKTGDWYVFKTSFTVPHWKKEGDIYMGVYKETARKMFEEEIKNESE